MCPPRRDIKVLRIAFNLLRKLLINDCAANCHSSKALILTPDESSDEVIEKAIALLRESPKCSLILRTGYFPGHTIQWFLFSYNRRKMQLCVFLCPLKLIDLSSFSKKLHVDFSLYGSTVPVPEVKVWSSVHPYNFLSPM